MATGYIFNAFGRYEDQNGTKGITLWYAGIPWFLPYRQVTPIPNWTFREVDHDKSTPPLGEVGELVYQSVVVPGDRIAEELVDKQQPVSYSQMGVMRVTGKSTSKELTVDCGWDAEGRRLETQVIEREVTRAESQEAEARSEAFKKAAISEYFMSKRERMNGGKGKSTPDARMPNSLLPKFMEELDIVDNDDITAHAKNAGMNPALLKDILVEVMSAMRVQNQETVAQAVTTAIKQTATSALPNGGIVRNADKGKRSLGLAEHKAAHDAEHPEDVVQLSTT